MIRVGVTVRGLDELRDCYPAVEAAILASAQITADHTVMTQETEALRGAAADGGPQRPNSERTRRAKARAGITPNVPLYRTGVFLSRASWKVALDRSRKRVRLAPFGKARAIAARLQTIGFRLAADGLPPQSLAHGREWLQRRLDRISRGRRR